MTIEPQRGQGSSRDAESVEDEVDRAGRGKARPRRKGAREGNEIRGRRVAGVATSQKGAISRRQLQAEGLAPDVIDRRALTGQLHRMYRGVYLVGHEALAPLARESAALLACGDGAILSHESAALAWSMLTEYNGDVHVTLVGRKRRSRSGLRVHRAATVPQTRRRHGLLVTSPAWTLIHLAAVQSPHLEHAFVEGHGLRLIRSGELARAIERAQPRRGVRALRALIGAYESGYTRSKAEAKLRALIRAGNLPQASFNVCIRGYLVDCVWQRHRLVVEVDGEGFHGHPRAFEVDRQRDAALVAAGYAVIRVT